MIESLSQLDRSLFLLINSWNATWLNPIMVFFSGQLIWIPFILLIFYLAYSKLDKKSFSLFLLFMALTIIASDVSASYLMKNIFQRLRPCKVAELSALINNFGQKCGGRFGFVSSHAANSICILVFSFLSLQITNKKVYLLWLLPLIVSFSRIYLGVHYPGDIIGGLLIGTFWGSVMAWFFRNKNLGRQSA